MKTRQSFAFALLALMMMTGGALAQDFDDPVGQVAPTPGDGQPALPNTTLDFERAGNENLNQMSRYMSNVIILSGPNPGVMAGIGSAIKDAWNWIWTDEEDEARKRAAEVRARDQARISEKKTELGAKFKDGSGNHLKIVDGPEGEEWCKTAGIPYSPANWSMDQLQALERVLGNLPPAIWQGVRKIVLLDKRSENSSRMGDFSPGLADAVFIYQGVAWKTDLDPASRNDLFAATLAHEMAHVYQNGAGKELAQAYHAKFWAEAKGESGYTRRCCLSPEKEGELYHDGEISVRQFGWGAAVSDYANKYKAGGCPWWGYEDMAELVALLALRPTAVRGGFPERFTFLQQETGEEAGWQPFFEGGDRSESSPKGDGSFLDYLFIKGSGGTYSLANEHFPFVLLYTQSPHDWVYLSQSPHAFADDPAKTPKPPKTYATREEEEEAFKEEKKKYKAWLKTKFLASFNGKQEPPL